MFTGKIRRILIMLLSLVTVSTLVTTAACTPAEAEMLRGVLENVDSVNGKVTIVTEDGKTVTVKVTTETEVEADGASTSLEDLESGASVDIEVEKDDKEDDGVARHIEARQAEAEGIITTIVGDNITIETERGNSVTVRVTDNSTRIKFEDDLPGTLADLRVGMEVEAKFDPSTRLALKIKVEEEEEEPSALAPATGGWGIIEIRVTDAPRTDNVTEIWVKVSEVQIHKATNGEGEWISANITGPNPFDLLTLKAGGIQQVLATANITSGKYTQIRMYIEKVQVRLGSGPLQDATLPSGKLKFGKPFEVKDWSTTVLLFDFDAEKSVKITGSGEIMVKPVIKLIVEKPKPTEGAVKITPPPSLPNGAYNIYYTATLQATGGTLPYTWSVFSGSLPTGLTLNSAGVISGTPTAPGDYTVTIKVSDNSTPVKSDTKQFTITVAAADALIITTTSLPDGKEDEAYTTTLHAIGGATPYIWSVTSGNLTNGLILNPATGLISGTPTKKGNFKFMVTVSDNSTPLKSDTQELSIRIIKD